MLQLPVKKLVDHASLPVFATSGSACFDIQTIHSGIVEPHRAYTFATGLAFEVPDAHVMLLFSRSGHGFKAGVRLANCVGVIDSDYRGELMVRLHNDSENIFVVNAGDRIAQGMLVPIPIAQIVSVGSLSNTERGDGGLGSTGR